jgi:mRNA-degrading endonuclease YafQ of YafQ-DinJ toxin-antitoxin module
MLKPIYLGQFEKDVAKSVKRKKDIEKLKNIITLLCSGHALPIKNRNIQIFLSNLGYFSARYNLFSRYAFIIL